MLSIDVQSYIKMRHRLATDFNISFSEIDALIPWERDLEFALISSDVEERNKAREEAINK